MKTVRDEDRTYYIASCVSDEVRFPNGNVMTPDGAELWLERVVGGYPSLWHKVPGSSYSGNAHKFDSAEQAQAALPRWSEHCTWWYKPRPGSVKVYRVRETARTEVEEVEP